VRDDLIKVIFLDDNMFKNYKELYVRSEDHPLDVMTQLHLIPENNSCKQIPFVVQICDSHFCIPEYCIMKDKLHSPLAYQPVSVCKTSGYVHVCGQHCKSYLINSGGDYECTITGLIIQERIPTVIYAQITSAPISNPLTQPSHRNKIYTSDDIETLLHTTDNLLRTNIEMGRIRLDSYDTFYAYAMRVLLSLVCERATKKKLLIRHVSKNSQKKQPIRMFDLLSITNEFDSKSIYHARLDLNDEERVHFAKTYASKCIKLWYIVMRYTKDANNRLFKFTNFITPAIYTLINGLSYFDSDGNIVHIIIPDIYLKTIPMCINMEDYASSSKNTKTRSRSTHNTYQLICKAIRTSALDNANPEVLKIENLSVDDMDISMFEKYKTSGAFR
jgi:hypothetical protein